MMSDCRTGDITHIGASPGGAVQKPSAAERAGPMNLKDQRGTDRFKVLVGIALLAPES